MANKNLKLLSVDDILAVDDRPTADVEVPEWGGVIRLRAMSAEEMIAFTDEIEDNSKEAIVGIIRHCAVGETGEPLFTTEEQVEGLRKKSFAAFKRLQTEALKINGMGDQGDAEGND